MSNAKLHTPVSSKGSKTMNDSIYHIIRATLLSVIVWYTLTHLADLIQSTNDLLAAPPHTRTVITIALSVHFRDLYGIHRRPLSVESGDRND